MCPGVLTETSAIDGSVVLVRFVVIDRSIDVDVTIEGAATVVVTTIDTCTVATHEGITTIPVDVGFIYVARIFVVQTVSTTKDSLSTEGRTSRYVDHRTTGDTLLIATAINRLELTAQQVDDC